ncbi:hypothetical protein FDECE_9341 [Fusarium decemcellulare]|nr:hypothetical protein FDECE_9341 [Fusarium decemcellulare]
MPPLQGAPQPTPLEEGASSSEVHPNAYRSDDAEPTSFLENLDMSDFQDFDFSPLMDLDHPESGRPVENRDVAMADVFNTADQTIPTAEQVSSNFNNVQLSVTDDPSSIQLSDEDWLRQIPELNILAPLPLEPVHTFDASFLSPAALPQSHQSQWKTPQELDNCPHNHQIQVPGEMSGGTHSWTPSQLGGSDPVMLSGTIPIPSMLDERQRTYAHASAWGIASNPGETNPITPASGPIIRYQDPLPPARRGGRRRRLTVQQAQRQQMARSNGVCIRCRLTGRSCEGGFPCKACLALRKPRLWRGPCTKAQFLEIIESGSFFLMLSIPGETDAGPVAVRESVVAVAWAKFTHVFDQETCSNLTEAEVAEFMDRQHRVRTALWIYASISIAKLPPWANFWEHLPRHLQAFRRSSPMDLKSSLKDFDLGFSGNLPSSIS